MKRVCLFNFPAVEDFHGYRIDSFDPLAYFGRHDHWDWNDLILWGLNGFLKRRGITAHAEAVDNLYREKDRAYMRLVSDFIERFREYDIIVMSTYNFIHPEILYHELKRPIKILGFIDDPLSTYMRGLPYLWAFDGAFYISPSYDERTFFPDALERWGCERHYWWPLVVQRFKYMEPTDEFFSFRDIDLIYIGNASRAKLERLLTLKKTFGKRFVIHGRWPLKGYGGIARVLFGKPIFPYRVVSVSDAERANLYHRVKIGINMHVSHIPRETGNMRMYELPAHGVMQICDRGGCDANEKIFEPNIEAIYYDDISHAIELISYFLEHHEERIRVARAGFERFWRDYTWELNLKRFLDWAGALRAHV